MGKSWKSVCSIFGVTVLLLAQTACSQEHAQNVKVLEDQNRVTKESYLFNNQAHIIPITGLQQKSIASVSLGFSEARTFDSLMNKYTQVTPFNAEAYKDSVSLNYLENELKFFNTVVISIEDKEVNNPRYQSFIHSVGLHKMVILAVFGNGNSLSAFENLKTPIIWTQSLSAVSAATVPQLIFGGIAFSQTLKGTITGKFKAGSAFKTTVTRLKYTVPEDAGVNSDNLSAIDGIAADAINGKATPGLVVLIAKEGKVIFNKAYGYHTYENLQPDKVTDIFDLASVTKITATTPSVMRLVEQKRLQLDTNVGAYIPEARHTPMNQTVVRDVMLHQAGFKSYIPFHNYIKEGDYRRDSTELFDVKVADNYYVKKDFFTGFMWPTMLKSPITTQGKYVYSDISMYVMKDIVEHITEQPITKYISDNFYAPLGMQTAGYLPRNRFTKDRIVPTEDDQVFRKTLLVGYVHDQGAALAGGVAGHAGLFSSGNDLAIYYQMLLNRGTYGGEQYFKPETVDMFTAKQSDVSRRGLGFDRWDPDPKAKYPSEFASPQTYGHTGYTGISVWVDPTRQLVYIFLSNRVNPTVTDKLSTLAIRRRIMDTAIQAIDKGL